ncbi:MAG: DUF5060 domain-containing protein, partial [Granulosicoccus sp.]|nr:DUF5060 domain-containing protein [Granulosicoccus sp.]
MQSFRALTRSLFSLVLLVACSPVMAASINGELYKWHPVELDFNGPFGVETDTSPNPFLDYRLTVELTSPGGVVTRVPGFFAGDGQGGGRGAIWRVRFSADETGRWTYHGRLQRGTNIAVSLSADEGSDFSLSGATGEFTIEPAPLDAPPFLRHGRLEHVGEHYLKFRDGPYWIKGGTDSPENLLGYAGIDGTYDHGGINGNFLHDFAAHREDFREGDPIFSHSQTGADSRGLIGALNYLGEQGVNSIYFLPMNLGGDGQETYPFIGADNTHYDKTHYDISKLYQWNRVLAHAQRQNIALNVVLSETEQANERWLDDGALGVERKLFFRELVARFGYLLAIKWNLGEENDFTRVELDKHADYLQAIDWSGKPIAVHTHINQFYRYGEIVGDKRYEATSIQYDAQYAGQFVEQWRGKSASTGHKWVVDMDENTNGLGPSNTDERRKQILYDVLFSGGNIEWYFGYNPLPAGGDVDAGDFRQRESMWRQMRLAREMMQNELPFWRMEPADWRVSGDSDRYGGAEVFALSGDVYAIYLPSAQGTELLDTDATGARFDQRWFDPRTGQMFDGPQDRAASDAMALGSPPYAQGEDWVVLVSRQGLSMTPAPDRQAGNLAPRFDNLTTQSASVGQRFIFIVTATDPDGTFPSVTVGALPAGMLVRGLGNGQLELDWTVPATADQESVVELIAIDTLDNALRGTRNLLINVSGTTPQTGNDGSSTGHSPDESSASHSAPVFTPVAPQTVKAGDLLVLRIQAPDADGIPPALNLVDP